MNEIDKMRKSELADMEKPEIQASFIHAKKLLAKMRTMTIYDEDFRQILEELVPNIPITSIICPPFIVTMAPVSNWENMYLSILIVLFGWRIYNYRCPHPYRPQRTIIYSTPSY